MPRDPIKARLTACLPPCPAAHLLLSNLVLFVSQEMHMYMCTNGKDAHGEMYILTADDSRIENTLSGRHQGLWRNVNLLVSVRSGAFVAAELWLFSTVRHQCGSPFGPLTSEILRLYGGNTGDLAGSAAD